MKRKDIVLIIVVVFVSGVFSLVISNYLFAAPEKRQEEVEVVEPITAEFTTPDKKYFNAESINPTRIITVGSNNNQQPFNQQ